MTLQMSATPLSPASPAARSETATRRVAEKPMAARPAWNNERLQSFMTDEDGGLGTLGPRCVEENFRDARPGTIKAGNTLELPETMIVAISSDVILEPVDAGCLVTGTRGKNNECRLIFRHAYSHVRCDVRIPNGAAESRITFLRSPSHRSMALAELHSFNLCQPLVRTRNQAGGFSMTLDYHADALNEVQGILWRGGLLEISRIHLTP